MQTMSSPKQATQTETRLDWSWVQNPVDEEDTGPCILLRHDKYEGVVFKIKSMGYDDRQPNEDGSFPFAVDYDVLAVADHLPVEEFTDQYHKEEFEEIVVNIAIDIMAKVNATREYNSETVSN